jgi:sortase A
MTKRKIGSPGRLFLLQKIFGRSRTQQIGSFLMILAFSCLTYIYYPLFQLFLPIEPHAVSSASKISIPKINIEAPINWNVDPFNKEEYREVLKSGVAHAKGTSFPAQDGTMFIFAHSSDFPWMLTRYNIIFFRLGELQKGDEIIVTRDGRNYKYKVREKKNVWPNEVKYLTEATRTQLILQTCTPPGTAFMRLLVFADPI